MQKALFAACIVGTGLSAGAAQQTAYLLYQSPPVSVGYDDTSLDGTCIETCDFNILAAEAGADAGAFSLLYSAASPIPSRLSFSTYLYEANVPGAERVTASGIRYDVSVQPPHLDVEKAFRLSLQSSDAAAVHRAGC